ELPAYHWELDAVESEGIYILERTAATRILTENGKVVGIELAHTTKGFTKDNHGRSRPKIKEGTEFALKVDTVIGTVGQFSDLNFLDSRYDDLPVDGDSLASEIPGLFVVGGRKTGASYIIDSISLGHRVAKSIHHYLQGDPLDTNSAPGPSVVEFSREEMTERVQSGEIMLQPRIEPSLISMDERVTSFREVVLSLTEYQAREEAKRCLQCGICSECLACVIACGADAIDLEMIAQEKTLNAGGMILAPGYQTYRAELSEEYGYGRYPNVLTSIQFERLLSASGPTLGHINRPSDEKVPKRIAFLQCIGSRDQDHNYCSSTCCMAATKEAVIAKQHHPEIEIHVFMMDMRAYSKGYWEYFVRAQEQYGVQYHRCRISGLSENSETNNLILQHLPEDSATFKTVKDEFDLVVLSVGMEISEDVRVLGRRLGIDLDEYGFCHNVKFNPIETSLPGIYAVGPFREPKDIPESVIEASGAAGAIGTFLNEARFTQTRTVEFPAERDIQCAPPRVGVFVCHCGSNIGGYLDVPEVTEYASTLPLVVHAEDNLYSCSQDSIKHITKIVEEENLNRVVVASCTPLTHQPLFRNSIRDAGLNPYLFEMANIRNQCSWVHSTDNLQATKKAKDLVRMAVAKVIKQTAQSTIDVPIEKTGLVVGGGAAGMTAALTLADNGFPVHLVEKDAELGGQLRNIHTQLNGKDPQLILKELLHRTGSHKNITVHLNSQVTETSGFKGNFSSQIRDEDERTESINHGVTILATGGMEYTGSEYGFGSDPRILTQQAFEGLITDQSGELIANPPKSVVMIQCIGPAEDYCSRICCTVALKNALALKEKLPDTQVSIIYKDIRVFGFYEKLYTDVRDLGVLFFRYDDDHKPEVNIKESQHPDSLPDASSSTLTISVWDKSLQRTVKLNTDLLVLSMPVIPHPDMKDLANKFKVSLDNNGFFLEAHVKLRPVDFSTEGIFMAGLAHFPKLIDESMIQAQAAASRASVLLSKDFLKAGGAIAVVEQQDCTGCLTCVRVCPFGVPVIQADVLGVGNVLGAAYIEPAICQGCGICVAECPAKAIDLMHYTEDQLRSKVTALLNPESILLEVI
ncbi:MAG: FAD-binding protein, partial [Anaerolineales bacterium]|nr:FAD-binding protein [Anaerolineales bacterium]